MQYTVVHSKDPYLLARLATDLELHGLKNERSWNEEYHPFETDIVFKIDYLLIGSKSGFQFHTHDCECEYPTYRHELTSRNYIKVLTQILQP